VESQKLSSKGSETRMFEIEEESPGAEHDPSEKFKAYQEGLKLYFEACKHMTTLSTASLLLLVTFLEKIFTNPKWKLIVVLAFASFILSIFLSIAAMLNFAETMKNMGRVSSEQSKKTYRTYSFSTFLFINGILDLVIFTLRNFYG
jgi:hypothetical protein